MKEHWCLADNCKHGTLNGSLSVGSLFVNEYTRGYVQGKKEAHQDDDQLKDMIQGLLAWYQCANDDIICKQETEKYLMNLCRMWGDRSL